MINYISYFTQCHIADNKSIGLLNYNSQKYDHQSFLKGKEELVNKTLPFVHITQSYLDKVSKTLALYENDKELWYGTIFISSSYKSFNSRIQKIFAPLFLFKVNIKKVDEDSYLELDFDSFQINTALIKKLDLSSSFTELKKELDQLWRKYKSIGEEFIFDLDKILSKHVIDLEIDLSLFPELLNRSQLNAISSDKSVVLPASGFYVSSRISNTSAIVNELQELEQKVEFSEGLKAFFNSNSKPLLVPILETPILLNNSQIKAAKNAHKYNKSIIYGPPGTGKTHTIASIALDYVSKQKSVLIVTQTDQALDVIKDKLNNTSIKDFVVKCGGRHYKRSLKSKLKKIINGSYIKQSSGGKLALSSINRRRILENLEQLEKEFNTKTEKEVERVEKFLNSGFFTKILNDLEIGIFRRFEDDEWKIIENYFTQTDEYNINSKVYLKYLVLDNLIKYAKTHLKDIVKLNNAIGAYEKSDLYQVISSVDFKVLSGVFPVWLAKIDQVSEFLPLKEEIFDLVIVDEATQCNIASCLPIFQRAKKIIVAGDQNQLKHISFLSTSYMNQLQLNHKIENKFAFNYRKKSLLDFCIESTSTVDQVTMLDEHFRSLPDIIKFSNEQFYDKELRIMTQTPINNAKQSLFLHETNGKQESKSNINKTEVEHIITQIKKVIQNELEIPSKRSSTIGILSPFSEQVRYLSKQVSEFISLKEIKKHRIKIGSPYSFQGDERDFMYISMSIDDNAHHAKLRYLDKPDVFNVAITRAKKEQHIFKSFDHKLISPESLISQFIESITENKLEIESSNLIDDDFVIDIKSFFENNDFKVFTDFSIAGLAIDVLIEKDSKYWVIDLIGYPGPCLEAFDIERYKILNRVGIPVIPLSYISWIQERKEVEKTLLKIVKSKK